MHAHTRSSDPAPSHLAEQRVNEGEKRNPKKVWNAILDCVQQLREFNERGIRRQMARLYPGSDVDSKSICSLERIRGVLSKFKKLGAIVPVESPHEQGLFQYVRDPDAILKELKLLEQKPPDAEPQPEPATKQTELF